MNRHGFRARFLRYSTKRRYDLMSALRGPDDQTCGRSTLKTIITARVRAIVLHEAGGSLYRDYPLTVEELTQVKLVMEKLSKSDHYIGHLRDAVTASLDHPIWNKHGRSLLSILGG